MKLTPGEIIEVELVSHVETAKGRRAPIWKEAKFLHYSCGDTVAVMECKTPIGKEQRRAPISKVRRKNAV